MTENKFFKIPIYINAPGFDYYLSIFIFIDSFTIYNNQHDITNKHVHNIGFLPQKDIKN